MDKEKRYRVVKDLQGGDFAFELTKTIDEWREQALEWCSNILAENPQEIIQVIKELQGQELMDFIARFWALEFIEEI